MIDQIMLLMKYMVMLNLDWVVLLSNNIINIQNEWPLNQQAFETYLLDKYGTLQN